MSWRTVLFVGILLSVPLIYAFAFASPTVELNRSADIQVDTDEQGILILNPNTDYDIIQADPDLSIDPANVGADSFNENAQLTLGNPTNPNQDNAFTIQNTRGTPIVIDVSLQGGQDFTGSADSVVYYIETTNGVTDIQVGDTTTIELQDGEEISVAVEFTSIGDTGDISTELLIEGGSV